MPEAIRCVLLYMLEAVERGLCLLEVCEAILCALLCMLEAADRRLRLLEVLEAAEGGSVLLEVPEVMRCVFSVC